jgi:hypothetical protein
MRQGPESFLPELVKVGIFERDDPFNSSFGPYSLTRLCYETGGIFFAVVGNRSGKTGAGAAQFRGSFDAHLMLNYRPDYVPVKEYQQLVAGSRARVALVQAAQMAWMAPLKEPQMVFPVIDEASFASRLSIAQRAAAVLEPKIQQLYDVLKQGERDRPKLTSPRWRAGYDLSLGHVLALKVRTETYNAILAKAKSGMAFQDPKNDTWILAPDNEITVGSAWEKMSAEAHEILERVKREHPGTPWAALADEELKQPLGWKWREAFTDVGQRRQRNRPRPPDMPRPVKRPPPKL